MFQKKKQKEKRMARRTFSREEVVSFIVDGDNLELTGEDDIFAEGSDEEFEDLVDNNSGMCA